MIDCTAFVISSPTLRRQCGFHGVCRLIRQSRGGSTSFSSSPRSRRCRRRSRRGCTVVSQRPQSQPLGGTLVTLRDDEETRNAFGEAVVGEWAGFEAEFDPKTSEPVVIPNYCIPEEFVEWNMMPLGFETNHSVILRGTNLYHKHFRILPAVSHFGDHVDLEEKLTVFDVVGDAGFLAFPDGSFSAGPSSVMTEHKSLLDPWPKAHLVLRNNGVAVHAHVTFDFQEAVFVENLRVVIEKYSCRHCDGGDIAGSSGYVEGWSAGEALDPAQLAGEWIIAASDSVEHANVISRPNGGPPKTPHKHLYLPEGIDISIEKNGSGEVAVHLAWLALPNNRIVLTRSYTPDGSLRNSYRLVESKI